MKVVNNILIITLLTFAMCSDREKSGEKLDTPTTGSIKIAADESLRPLVEGEVDTFNGLYPRAEIKVDYYSEAEVFDAFMKDSARLIVVSRHLTPSEKSYFKERQISTTEVDVAVSGIALIVNKQNQDTLISVKQLISLLKGEISSWKELGSKRKDGIEIVFDNPSSGMIRYLKDSLARTEKLPANCFAVQNNQAVVDHVSKNLNAMGLIGLEWISDKDDTTATGFLKKVRVMGVSDDSTHFQPYQAYIALKHYPLTRTITVINNAARTGLNAGFSRFFQSEQGQRIVLKAGLVPKTMPLRIVQFK
jgi:phosphate transport system substrate-binding protein